MAINVKILSRSLFDTARDVAGNRWSEARGIVEMELGKLTHGAGEIERLLRQGSIDATRARDLFDIHRSAARMALLTVEVLTPTTAERLLAIATAAIGKAITRSLGIPII
jgi:hypothetical protein